MVDIIATTRGEKIKKIASLSSNIIEEYGIGYFLKVATYEIWNQKLNLLRPDAIPKISLEEMVRVTKILVTKTLAIFVSLNVV